jgi:hypothetical protein
MKMKIKEALAGFHSNRKGQFLIVSLIATFMTLIAFIALYPILKVQIDNSVVNMDVYSATLLQLAPFFILISILLTIVFASLPTRE